MDEVVTPDLGILVYEQIRAFIIRQGAIRQMAAVSREKDNETAEGSSSTSPPPIPDEESPAGTGDDAAIAAELAKLDHAFSSQILYIIGKEQMKVKPGTRLWRRILLNTFLWLRENTRTKIANLPVSIDRVVEVGFVKEV
jgi:KUP system potassium uptake protein